MIVENTLTSTKKSFEEVLYKFDPSLWHLTTQQKK